MKKILITSALPYANGPLHFGHIAGAYLPGDCYARYQRLKGNDVLYICGSDEYGVAIKLSAEMAGRTPKEHVDLYHEVNLNLFKRLHFSFDHYSRTTTSYHQEPVQQFFRDLLANGFIEEKVTDQLYSEADQRFLADRYVVGVCPACAFPEARGDECPRCGASFEATDLKDPRSKLTGAPLVHRGTNHWFLMLDKMKEKLTTWLSTKHWKPNVVNFVKGFVADLHPRAITRDSDWGVPLPLPNTEGKVLYVWFDAPIGYISATMEWSPERWRDYWLDPDTLLVHFIGKDNIPFHAATFPAMIMGQNTPYKLVDELPANEFYMLEGKQFSKSEGWMIDLETFFDNFTADQIRFMIAATAPETADSEFTWREFQLQCNSNLLGKLGNLVNRVLVFTQNKCGGQIPDAPVDPELQATIDRLVKEADDAYATFRLRKATSIIMELAQAGNVFFDSRTPWKDVKDPTQLARLNTTLASCFACIKALALISAPIIPDTSARICRMLALPPITTWDSRPPPPGPLGPIAILFRRIEDDEIAREVEKLGKLTAK